MTVSCQKNWTSKIFLISDGYKYNFICDHICYFYNYISMKSTDSQEWSRT